MAWDNTMNIQKKKIILDRSYEETKQEDSDIDSQKRPPGRAGINKVTFTRFQKAASQTNAWENLIPGRYVAFFQQVL